MANLLVGSIVLVLLFQVAFGNPLIAPRIVGAEKAPEGRYPYMASIRLYYNHLCGGAILNKNWVVSTAGCLYQVDSERYIYVFVGSNTLQPSPQLYRATKLIRNSKFNPITEHNDIALVQVSDIKFSEEVQPISLYAGIIPDNSLLTLLGWGQDSKSGTTTNDLQYVNSATLSLKTCQQSNQIYPIIESQLCTYAENAGGNCRYDDGGPVVTTNENGQDLLVGLISFNKPCVKGNPDVHTRVYSFVSWINYNCNYCVSME